MRTTFSRVHNCALLFDALLLAFLAPPVSAQLVPISFTAQDIGASPEQHLVARFTLVSCGTNTPSQAASAIVDAYGGFTPVNGRLVAKQ